VLRLIHSCESHENALILRLIDIVARITSSLIKSAIDFPPVIFLNCLNIMSLARPSNAVTVIACIVLLRSMSVALYFVWNSRKELAEYIRAKGKTTWLSTLHVWLLLLAPCANIVNHV